MFVEVGVNSHRHVVANAHHGPEGISAKTHMGILAHGLETLTLLLHGIVVATETINLEGRGLNLTVLTSTLTLH